MEEYKLSRRISVYLSMPSEVQTEGILKDIFQTKKDCFVPRYIGSNMDMVKLDSMEDFFSLPLTSWNIRQPAEDDEREEALISGGIDLIVVPGLGFTKHGLRLGRGKGYYDNYIKKCIDNSEMKPYLVGLAFSTQICDDLPITERDMNMCKSKMVLPRGFHLSPFEELEPDPLRDCALPTCQKQDDSNWCVLKGCGYSFQVTCVPNRTCPICQQEDTRRHVRGNA
ncbi:5-formyltetrahydrofolate cyclo-ligase-like isoform X5 [Acropora millepora]|nr:5-formyltetrahydrofolate cyclo-ligase-like isoform X5 [Acropora millepora]